MRLLALWSGALLLATLVGCGGAALRWEPGGTHVVQEGETLYSIAWRYDLDHELLARWNGLGDGSLIKPGQRLRLDPPPKTATAAAPQQRETPATPASPTRPNPAVQQADSAIGGWQWPARGPILSSFGAASALGKGIDIGGQTGDPVMAAADGRVVYAGSGLRGYGQLIIVKHNNRYLSAYGYNNALLVEEGDAVTAGQRIARMGQGPGNKPVLHFEIRRDGKPVDPLGYLPMP